VTGPIELLKPDSLISYQFIDAIGHFCIALGQFIGGGTFIIFAKIMLRYAMSGIDIGVDDNLYFQTTTQASLRA